MKNSELLLTVKARRLAASGEGMRLRINAGLSLRETADAVGVAVSTLWRWERGERSPRGGAALSWARLLEQLAADAKAVA